MPISEVYNCDCLEYMRSLPDKHFDLCIADPPFGINIHKSGRLKKYNQQWVDDEIPQKEVFDEMFRVSKDVIIWGGNYFLDYLGSTKCFLIYDKKQPQGITFASCEFAWTSFDSVAKTFYYSPMQMKDRIHSCQYANGKGFSTKDEIAYQHPAIFPEKLVEDHIKSWSNEGDVVLDPFMGSGTTGKMAILNNRNFIGIELNEEYFKIAQQRIANTQPRLL